eukprot:g5578.t1
MKEKQFNFNEAIDIISNQYSSACRAPLQERQLNQKIKSQRSKSGKARKKKSNLTNDPKWSTTTRTKKQSSVSSNKGKRKGVSKYMIGNRKIMNDLRQAEAVKESAVKQSAAAVRLANEMKERVILEVQSKEAALADASHCRNRLQGYSHLVGKCVAVLDDFEVTVCALLNDRQRLSEDIRDQQARYREKEAWLRKRLQKSKTRLKRRDKLLSNIRLQQHHQEGGDTKYAEFCSPLTQLSEGASEEEEELTPSAKDMSPIPNTVVTGEKEEREMQQLAQLRKLTEALRLLPSSCEDRTPIEANDRVGNISVKTASDGSIHQKLFDAEERHQKQYEESKKHIEFLQSSITSLEKQGVTLSLRAKVSEQISERLRREKSELEDSLMEKDIAVQETLQAMRDLQATSQARLEQADAERAGAAAKALQAQTRVARSSEEVKYQLSRTEAMKKDEVLLKSKLTDALNESELLRSHLLQKEEALTNAQRKIVSSEAALVGKEKQLDEMREKLKTTEKEESFDVSELKREVKSLKKALQTSLHTEEKLKQESRELNERVKDIAADKNALVEGRNQLVAELELSTHARTDLTAYIERLQISCNELSASNAALEEAKANVDSEREAERVERALSRRRELHEAEEKIRIAIKQAIEKSQNDAETKQRALMCTIDDLRASKKALTIEKDNALQKINELQKNERKGNETLAEIEEKSAKKIHILELSASVSSKALLRLEQKSASDISRLQNLLEESQSRCNSLVNDISSEQDLHHNLAEEMERVRETSIVLSNEVKDLREKVILSDKELQQIEDEKLSLKLENTRLTEALNDIQLKHNEALADNQSKWGEKCRLLQENCSNMESKLRHSSVHAADYAKKLENAHTKVACLQDEVAILQSTVENEKLNFAKLKAKCDEKSSNMIALSKNIKLLKKEKETIDLTFRSFMKNSEEETNVLERKVASDMTEMQRKLKNSERRLQLSKEEMQQYSLKAEKNEKMLMKIEKQNNILVEEKTVLLSQIDEMRALVDSHLHMLQDAKDRNSELMKEKNSAVSRISNLENQLGGKKNELKLMQSTMKDMEELTNTLYMKIEDIEQQLIHNIEKAEAKIQKWQAVAESAKADVLEMGENAAAYKDTISMRTKDLELLQRKLKDVNECKQNEKKKLFQELLACRSALNDEKNSTKKILNTLEKERRKVSEVTESLKKSKAKASSRIMEKSEECKQLKEDLQEAMMTLDGMRESMAVQKVECESAAKREQELKKDILNLQARLTSFEDDNVETRGELQRLSNTNTKLRKKILSRKEKFLETHESLKERTEQCVCLKQKIEELDEKLKERSDDIEVLQVQIAKKNQALEKRSDESNLLKERLEQASKDLSSKEVQFEEKLIQMNELHSKKLLQAKKENDKILQKIETTEKRLHLSEEKMSRRNVQLSETCHLAEEESKQLRTLLKEANLELMTVRDRLREVSLLAGDESRQLRSLLKEATDEFSTMKHDYVILEQSNAMLLADMKKANDRIHCVTLDHDDIRDQMNAAIVDASNLKAELDENEQLRRDERKLSASKLKKLQEKEKLLIEKLEHVESCFKESNENIDILRAKLKDLEMDRSQKIKEKIAIETAFRESKRAHKKLEQALKEMCRITKDDMDKLKAKLHEDGVELIDREKKLSIANTSLQSMKINFEKLRQDNIHCEKRLGEKVEDIKKLMLSCQNLQDMCNEKDEKYKKLESMRKEEISTLEELCKIKTEDLDVISRELSVLQRSEKEFTMKRNEAGRKCKLAEDKVLEIEEKARKQEVALLHQVKEAEKKCAEAENKAAKAELEVQKAREEIVETSERFQILLKQAQKACDMEAKKTDSSIKKVNALRERLTKSKTLWKQKVKDAWKKAKEQASSSIIELKEEMQKMQMKYEKELKKSQIQVETVEKKLQDSKAVLRDGEISCMKQKLALKGERKTEDFHDQSRIDLAACAVKAAVKAAEKFKPKIQQRDAEICELKQSLKQSMDREKLNTEKIAKLQSSLTKRMDTEKKLKKAEKHAGECNALAEAHSKIKDLQTKLKATQENAELLRKARSREVKQVKVLCKTLETLQAEQESKSKKEEKLRLQYSRKIAALERASKLKMKNNEISALTFQEGLDIQQERMAELESEVEILRQNAIDAEKCATIAELEAHSAEERELCLREAGSELRRLYDETKNRVILMKYFSSWRCLKCLGRN